MNRLIAFLPAIVCAAAFLLGCGGHSGGSGSSGGGGGVPGAPVAVTVAAGTSATADISVASPKSSPTPNAQFLGVNLAQGGATVTGDTVSRSQGTATMTMYGAGLTASMKVLISGPSDITVGTPVAIQAQDGTPGLQIPITLTSGSALGARTVILRDANNDISTFAGGLEVVP